MGGGAIKKNGASICSRLPRAAYLAIKANVLAKLSPHVTACEGVLELPGKADFGDLDVLYCQPEGANCAKGGKVLTVPDILKNHFGIVDPTHSVRHGPVTSFAYDIKAFLKVHCPEVQPPTDYFQVDFIRAPSPESLAMCRFYFGYGDVGGILGRIFNFYGMKFGEAGLWCELFSNTVQQLKGEVPILSADEVFGHVPVQKKAAAVASAVDRPAVAGGAELLAKAEETDASKRKEGVVDPTATLGRIPLTADPAAICSYAGLDYPKWCRGFNAVDDVVAWLVDCEFFRPSIFDRLNYEHMQRANKRPFYQKFLDHIDMTPGKAGGTQVRCNKQLEAITHFKQDARLDEILRGTELAKERRGKFNGKLLSAVIFEVQSADAADAIVDAAVAGAAAGDETTGTKPLEGKPLGSAISTFKSAVVAKKEDAKDSDFPVSTVPLDNQALEAAFNAVLDTMSAEEIHAEMILFAATYRPPTPPPAAAAKKQKKK